ncbi:MAG: RHS repeat-associated core domain-containing protein, partial [Gemmataceae bacterium]
VIGRRAYDAFGNTILDNSGRDFDRYGYTGADYDAFTGLTTHGVRVNEGGRWMQEDPIGFAAGDVNLHRYVGNNPTNASDPSGLQPPANGFVKEWPYGKPDQDPSPFQLMLLQQVVPAPANPLAPGLLDAFRSNRFNLDNLEELIKDGKASKHGDMVYVRSKLPNGDYEYLVFQYVPSQPIYEYVAPYRTPIKTGDTQPYYELVHQSTAQPRPDGRDVDPEQFTSFVRQRRSLRAANDANQFVITSADYLRQFVIDVTPGWNTFDKCSRSDTSNWDVVLAVLEDGSTVLTLGGSAAVKSAYLGVKTVGRKVLRGGVWVDVGTAGVQGFRGIYELANGKNGDGVLHLSEGLLRAALGRKGLKELKVATKAPSILTGQIHHPISTKIGRELEAHPTLKGNYTPCDPRFTTQAVDEASHKGYQKWHRELDQEVIDWLRDPKNRAATTKQFEDWLRWRYGQPDLKARFPNGF